MDRCYLFFLLSFLLLLVVWTTFCVSTVAWPLVFRWSNNLFLVGNSLLQVTQRTITSLCRQKQIHLNLGNYILSWFSKSNNTIKDVLVREAVRWGKMTWFFSTREKCTFTHCPSIKNENIQLFFFTVFQGSAQSTLNS